MNLSIAPRLMMVDPFALTRRERDVVLALGRGWKNKEAAAELGITEGSFKVLVSQTIAKTNMDRTHLTLFGVRMLEAMAS